MIKSMRQAQLEARLHVANRFYYDDPENAVMTDAYYDKLWDELQAVDPNSPVLDERGNYDRDVQHTRLVGSWNKCHTLAEVEGLFKTQVLMFTPKLDGASVTLYYSDGVLRQAVTRGDSTTGIGKDITANMLCAEDVPWHINVEGEVEVKGEAYIAKTDFFGVMDAPGYAGKPGGLANPRNAAAGAIRSKNPHDTEARSVRFAAYGLQCDIPHNTHAAKLHTLVKQGFKVPTALLRAPPYDDVLTLLVDNPGVDCELDGIVAIINDVAAFEAAGVSGICPRGGVAYKFETEIAETKIVDIEWRALRTGHVRPRGKVEMRNLCGTEVEYLTLNNYKWAMDRNICVGDVIEIKKANEIIPCYVRTLIHATDAPFAHPSECPACGTQLVAHGVHLVCFNDNCMAKRTEAVLHMLRKMNIKGIGPGTVDRMEDVGMIDSPASIFKLSADALVKHAGLGVKQAQNIVDALSHVELTPAQQLATLGIEGWGVRMFNKLFDTSTITYADLAHGELSDDTYEILVGIPGIGHKKALALCNGIIHNRELLYQIAAYTTVKAEPDVSNVEQLEDDQDIHGKTFCVTGKFEKGTRDDIHTIIRQYGGKPVDSVTAKTDYLLIADVSSTSSKAKAARKHGVTLIDEVDFIKMFKLDCV